MMMPSRQGQADGADSRPRPPAAISDRLIAEAQQLHALADELSQTTKVWSRPAARRQLREAKYAEADLLRVLGFDSYREFSAVVTRFAQMPAPEAETATAIPAESAVTATPSPTSPSAVTSAPDDARTRELERALGAALAEIEELRTKLAVGRPGVVADAPPAPAPVVTDEEGLVRSFVVDLERATAEVEALRATIREVHEMAVATAAELIAAKLEVIVAQRRATAQSLADPD